MERYIDADKLIAKIAELRKELPDTIEHLTDEESGFARGQQYELTAMEAEILCLLQEEDEQPEYGYLSTEYIYGKSQGGMPVMFLPIMSVLQMKKGSILLVKSKMSSLMKKKDGFILSKMKVYGMNKV